MKAFSSDLSAVLKLAALVAVIVCANAVTTSQATRGLDHEIVESERLNARYHARSLDDRDSIKRLQATNTQLIADLRRRVEALEAAAAAEAERRPRN